MFCLFQFKWTREKKAQCQLKIDCNSGRNEKNVRERKSQFLNLIWWQSQIEIKCHFYLILINWATISRRIIFCIIARLKVVDCNWCCYYYRDTYSLQFVSPFTLCARLTYGNNHKQDKVRWQMHHEFRVSVCAVCVDWWLQTPKIKGWIGHVFSFLSLFTRLCELEWEALCFYMRFRFIGSFFISFIILTLISRWIDKFV